MNDQVDQFGRDKSKPLSDDKSKKILESLAEIKNQLENKDYTPKVEVNKNISNRDVKSINSKNLDFDLLQKRIELLEEKLEDLNAYDVKQASKIILGSARSMGMEVV